MPVLFQQGRADLENPAPQFTLGYATDSDISAMFAVPDSRAPNCFHPLQGFSLNKGYVTNIPR